MTLQINMDDPEAEPLYSVASDEELSTSGENPQYRHWNYAKFMYLLGTMAYFALLIVYIILWVRTISLETQLHTREPALFPSLSHSLAFRKNSRIFSLTVAGTPFTGDPSLELDQAWHDLLEGTTIRVAPEDLDYYNITSLPLADGSGFASELFVVHELHCLKKIRQWVYKETYFAHVKGLARNELKRHIDHCIETLRQGIMCRGDVSLGTYTYLSGSNDVTARSWGLHECVDFEVLLKWMRKHTVDIFEEDALVKPDDLGPEHFTEKKLPH